MVTNYNGEKRLNGKWSCPHIPVITATTPLHRYVCCCCTCNFILRRDPVNVQFVKNVFRF